MRHSRYKRSQKNATHCEDQLGLVKLARVTLYRTYGDFDIWHFDTRNGFFFQVSGMRFLKECLQALPPSPFLSWIPLAADPALRPLAFSIVLTDREPGTGYILFKSCTPRTLFWPGSCLFHNTGSKWMTLSPNVLNLPLAPGMVFVHVWQNF